MTLVFYLGFFLSDFEINSLHLLLRNVCVLTILSFCCF